LISKLLLKPFQAVAHAAVPNIAADTNPHPTKQSRVDRKFRGQVGTVSSAQVERDLRGGFRVERSRGLDPGMTFLRFKPKQAFVILDDLKIIPRLLRQKRIDNRTDPPAIELPIGKTHAQHLARDLSNFFFKLHPVVVIYAMRKVLALLPPA